MTIAVGGTVSTIKNDMHSRIIQLKRGKMVEKYNQNPVKERMINILSTQLPSS